MNKRTLDFVVSLAVGSYASLVLLLAASTICKLTTGFDALSVVRSQSVTGLDTFVVILSAAIAVIVAGAVRQMLAAAANESSQESGHQFTTKVAS